jgi:Sulfotransferase family/Sulfotransferase domain
VATATADPPVSVLYIAGTGRSGSTVLAKILGEVAGVFSAGEVRYLWQRGLLERRLCGCGVPVQSCPVWHAVLERSGQSTDRDRVAEVVSLLRRSGRVRTLPAVMAGRLRGGFDPARSDASRTGRAALADVYRSIAAVTGSRVIVDSSKLPAYANLLAATPGIDLKVVHLVRDPRGAAHSWSSRKVLDDGAARPHMEQIGPGKSAVLWDVWNLATGALFDCGPDRYLRIRYEDFVSDPVASVRRILAMVGLQDSALPFVGPHEAITSVNHSVAGNPDRLRHGSVTLQRDDRWVRAMPVRHQFLVSAITAPLLLRYGYSLRPAAAQPRHVASIYERAPSGEGAAARLARRVRRHVHWARTEGVGRLIEEDELNPLTKMRVAASKRRWRSSHPRPAGTAVPVFVVGLQRSGTNMLTRGLDMAPEFEVHNENDRAAFDHFMLRDDARIRSIVMASRHEFVLFKPLCDSHRVDQLLDSLGTARPPRAIWAMRTVDGRVRSAVSKFGRNNLFVLRDIVSGNAGGMWQAQRLSPQILEQLGRFDYNAMTAETAAALFWWARNSLYFDMGLDRRDDVMLASYEAMVADPVGTMESICRFLGLRYSPALVAHISPRAGHSAPRPAAIDAHARQLCSQLQERFDAVLQRQAGGRAA